MDYFGRASSAGDETKRKTAEEKINLKITTAQMKSYVETQSMPTLQVLADELCEDNEIEYVHLKEQEQASLEKITVGDADSILTKLKEYSYEFEIDKDLKLASIDGKKIASTDVPAGYMQIPTATLDINQNGQDIDVLNYAKVNVNISSARSCTMQINTVNGIVTISDVENIKAITMIKDGKWYENKNNDSFRVSNSGTFYAIVIDDNGDIYVSNSVEYEIGQLVLYNYGELNTTTGGMEVSRMSNTSYDFTTNDFLEIYGKAGNNTSVATYTKNKIDVSKYNKLIVKFTQSDIAGNRSTYRFSCGLKDTAVTDSGVQSSLEENAWDYHEEEAVTEKTVEIDISEYAGEYYFEAVTMWSKVKIYSIILSE